MAVVEAQSVLAPTWVETLLQLEQLSAYSEGRFLDLAQVELPPWERWSATHWTADKREQTPQQGPCLKMAVTAHLSLAGEQGCDEPLIEAFPPHMISHLVDFAQFLSTIPACPAERVLVLLHLLFSRDRHHRSFNSELVASCATRAKLGTSRYMKLLVA